MKTMTDFPHEVRTIENLFIPMRDGARLAARLWLPIDADTNPVPAVLEYIPYRKRDNSRARDEMNHPYLAGHGYASIRVDMRGSGDSDGVLVDEYRPVEHEDAEDVIAWLAEQDWCDGNVGMMGISWGGFNSLQMAARRPPALKAIVSASATDDLYHDNMHYMDGALLADNLSEATVMFAFNSLPPDPAIVGEGWRDMWRQRLEGSGLWLEKWLAHQNRDDYWKTASVCEDYGDVNIPVMAVGGWADGYTNAIFRLMEHLDVPRKALIGPWGHKYPHLGVPGPAIGFLQEMVRWWDHWLKGDETGIMDEPMIRAWMQDSVPPKPSYEHRPGRWVAENAWPAPSIESSRYQLSHNGLRPKDRDSSDPDNDHEMDLLSPLSVGLHAGKWASYAAVPDLPSDQREDDGGSMVFDTTPLDDELEIFGRPEVHLEVTSDRPVAQLIARLSDVSPNGEVTRVTYGVLNLTHRNGSENPEPLEPGQPYAITIRLNTIAQSFPAGHRIRLALSTSYWPLIWPSPEPATITVLAAEQTLDLPVRGRQPADHELPAFAEPEIAPELDTTQVEPGHHHWKRIQDLGADLSVTEIVNDDGTVRINDTGTEMYRLSNETYSSGGNDVNSVRGETRTVRRWGRDDWRTEVRTRTVLTSTPTHFLISAELDAYELDEKLDNPRFYSQSWNRQIPRHLV